MKKWNEEIIIKELQKIISEIGHFPHFKELKLREQQDLCGAICRNGGINKFRVILDYKYSKKPKDFWNINNIKSELINIIERLGHFPTHDELKILNRLDLSGAMTRNGSTYKFREILGYELLHKPEGYWTEENTIKELKEVIENLGIFPLRNKLEEIGRADLRHAIIYHGGFIRFIELLRYDISLREMYIREVHSYCVKRGKKSENIVKQILQDYCILHNLPEPLYNKKLSKGNILEFVCNTNKTIGIDVINSKTGRRGITRKWLKKDYHKYLGELWIVVFSDTIIDQDYINLNDSSPSNVKIFSIYDFLKELNYSLDENTKTKIDKYNSCTFHTKEQLKEKIK